MTPEERKLRDQLCGEGVRFVGRMAHTVRSLRTYPIGSPAMRFGLEGMAAAATAIVDIQGKTRITLDNDRIRVGSYPVNPPPGMLRALRELRSWLRERGVGGIELCSAPTSADIHATLSLLISLKLDQLDEHQLSGQLISSGVRSLTFVICRPSADGDGGTLDEDPAVATTRLYLRGIRGVQRLSEQGLVPAVLVELTRLVQGMTDLIIEDPRLMLALLSARGVTPYALSHPLHRTILVLTMGHRIGMQKKDLLELGLCALSADWGLNRLPAALRERAGPLDVDARSLFQRHPLESIQALIKAGSLSPALRRRLLVAFELRLGHDRSGYPAPILWPTLHPFSRMIAVTEAYDALRSVRPWRPALSAERALQTITELSGRRYDPMIVDELSDMLTIYRFEDAHAR